MILDISANSVVESGWLADHLNDDLVRIVDATWFLPTEARRGYDAYLACHIPSAVHFDIDAVADRSTDLPHMLPDPEAFSRMVGALGIGNDHRIVVYDGQGMVTAPRVWWTFRVFGHDDVAVLNGGLPKWLAEGRATASGGETAQTAEFNPRWQPALVRDAAAMRAAIDSGGEQIVDARSPGRFNGTEPEPRPGVRSGHMPGARNLHYAELIDPAAQTLRPAEQLRNVFSNAGVELARPIATTCGSGVTAAILALALHQLGHDHWAVYDGSWSEWGARADPPIEV